MKFKGRFKIVIHDKFGHIKAKLSFPNGVVNEGKDKILDVMFHGVSQIATWYIGLIDGSSPSLSNADTLASKSWTENQNYSEGARQTWVENAASGQEITTNTPATFSISVDSQTIDGIFIASDSTKGGTSGTLWSTALFGTAQELDNGDTLKVEYELAVS